MIKLNDNPGMGDRRGRSAVADSVDWVNLTTSNPDLFEKLRAIGKESASYGVTVVNAMPSTITRLVDSWPPFPFSPTCVTTSGDTLDSHSRSRFEAYFGTVCVNIYALTECGAVAGQCPEGDHFHFDPAFCWLETVAADARRKGTLVASGLASRAMSFIRYRTGDNGTVSYETCSCGSSQPSLYLEAGRRIQYFSGESGLYDPFPLVAKFEKCGLSKFHLQQTRTNEFLLSHDHSELALAITEPLIEQSMKTVCGPQARLLSVEYRQAFLDEPGHFSSLLV